MATTAAIAAKRASSPAVTASYASKGMSNPYASASSSSSGGGLGSSSYGDALLAQGNAMLAQTKAQGSTPYAGSSFQEAFNASMGYAPGTPQIGIVNGQVPIKAENLNQAKVTVPSQPYMTEQQRIGQVIGDQNAQAMTAEQQYNLANAGEGLVAKGIKELFPANEATQAQDAFQAIQEQSGMNESRARINELRNQIALQTDYLNAGISKIGNEVIATPIIGKQQRLLADQQGRKIALLNSQLEVEQGNFEMAKDLVNMQYSAWKTDADRQFQIKSTILDQLSKQEDRNFDMYKMKVSQEYKKEDEWRQTQAQILTNMADQGIGGSAYSAVANAKPGDLTSLLAVGGKYMKSTKDRLEEELLGLKVKEARNSGGMSISDRKNLIEMAKGGDPYAIKQLGYDPNNIQGDPLKYEEARFENEEDIRRIDQLMSNDIGIKNTTGQWQKPKTSGFLKGLVGGTTVGTAVAPGVGTLIGGVVGAGAGVGAAIIEANQTDDFLADASYMLNTTTFDKLIELKAGGATFGSLSDPERVAIGRAANEFNAMAVTDEQGNIIGFRGSEAKLRKNLELIKKGFEADRRDNNIKYGLSVDDILEINSI